MTDPHPAPNRRILIIDDNASVREDFRKLFALAGRAGQSELELAEASFFEESVTHTELPSFELDFASQGKEGFHMVKAAAAAGTPYALAFIDMRMPPGWDGMETSQRLWAAFPDLQMVICTAYSDYSWGDMMKSFGHTDRLLLLKKPFDSIEVLQLAHSLTEKWRLVREAGAAREDLERRVEERTQALQGEIAARSAMEEVLRQAQKMEAVGLLAAGVAHDFDGLLAIIRGYAGLLLREPRLDSNSLGAVQEMDQAAQRAAHLTRQLLTFSRRQEIRPESLCLKTVIGDLRSPLSRLLGGAVMLEVDSLGKVPPVFADRGMLEQIILNLAANARETMPESGTLTLRLSAATFTPEEARHDSTIRAGRYACLSVTDTGRGIAPEILPRLFEPFFATQQLGSGTGLGLATVYGIAQQHDGWIEVASELGRGSTFKVFLPEAQVQEDELTAPVRYSDHPENIVFMERSASSGELNAGGLLRTA